MEMWRHLPGSCFFCELETDLGLSDPSQSPEKAASAPRHQSAISTMIENTLKFVEYIFPTSKDWTGLWFLRYRNLHLCFVNIDIVNLC
jgi:hypothetical protein